MIFLEQLWRGLYYIALGILPNNVKFGCWAYHPISLSAPSKISGTCEKYFLTFQQQMKPKINGKKETLIHRCVSFIKIWKIYKQNIEGLNGSPSKTENRTA